VEPELELLLEPCQTGPQSLKQHGAQLRQGAKTDSEARGLMDTECNHS
jgi:hypothetical protein